MIGAGIGTSTIFNGITGNVNTATNTQAMHFDNSGDFLRVDDSSDFSTNGGKAFSVACWIKRDSVSGGNRDGWFGKGTSTSNLEHRIFFIAGIMYYDQLDGGGTSSGNYRRVTYAQNSTSWQHLVFTSNGDSGVNMADGTGFYINGVKQTRIDTGGSDTDGTSDLAGQLRIGSTDDASFQLGGEMCQFIWWSDYALSQQDVTYLYAAGAAHRNPEQGAQEYGGASYVKLWLPLQSNADDELGLHTVTASGNAAVSSATVPF